MSLNGHGSLINALTGSSETTPVVGMGATRLSWSDRAAFTVIAVSKSGKAITVQADAYKRTDSNGMSECQTYEFSRDPNGRTYELRLGKRGWVEKGDPKGARFALGHRDAYYDYSF